MAKTPRSTRPGAISAPLASITRSPSIGATSAPSATIKPPMQRIAPAIGVPSGSTSRPLAMVRGPALLMIRYSCPTRNPAGLARQHIEAGHADRHAHFDLRRDRRPPDEVGDGAVDLDAAVHRAGMHHHC